MRFNSRIKRSNHNDLLRLSNLISQRRVDYDFIKEGGRIVYAVDSDIIKLFSNPKENAVDQGSFIGYCQFFKKSKNKSSINLAIALSHYLFQTLSKDVPLLVFDAQLKEIDSICHGLMKDTERNRLAQDNNARTIEEDLKDILALAKSMDKESKSPTDGKALKDGIESTSDKIIKGLEFGKELERISKLLKDDIPRFSSILFLLEHFSEVVKESYFRQSNEMFSANIIRAALDRKLEETKKYQLDENRLNDVSALYNLYFINKNLIESGENIRLVLISGDNKIVHASDILTTEITEDKEAFKSSLPNSFADLYIRHPLAFINDDDFIGDLEIENIKESILSLLLSLHEEGNNKNLNFEKMQEVSEFDDVASLFSVMPLHTELKVSQEEFEDRTDGLAKIFDEFIGKRLIHYSFELEDYEKNGKINTVLKKIRETSSGGQSLKELYSEANNLLIYETNTLAFFLQQENLARLQSEEKFCYRIPPFLRFEKVSAAEKYVRSWVFGDLDTKEDIRTLYKEVEAFDNSGYSAALCSSAIWTFLDDWKLVQENAGRALKIAFSLIDDGRSYNNYYLGHEAAYLSVVALRHLAIAKTRDEVSDLIERSRLYINVTKNFWDSFRKRNNLTNDLKPADKEYRFKHEVLSVDLMEMWYEVFHFEVTEKNENDKIVDSLINIKKQLFEIINKTEEDMKHPENEQKEDYLRYAQRHAINNYCMIFFILDKHEALYSVCKTNEIVNVLSIYDSTNDDEIKSSNRFKAKSYLHACTMEISKLLYLDKLPPPKKELRSTLRQLLTDENIKKFSRKPYEKKRFLFYRDVAGIS